MKSHGKLIVTNFKPLRHKTSFVTKWHLRSNQGRL